MTTINSSNHGLQAGDMVSYTKPETRWLVRLWKFITYKDHTVRLVMATVTGVSYSTTMEIN